MVQVVPSTNTTQVRARTTGTPNSIAVGSAQTYYEYSRDWAIKMDGMVEGVDYSSKYYANQSHEYADSILTDAGFIAVTESLTNINSVANNLDAINSVENNITAIDGLYQYRYEIAGVYSDLSSIQTVASNISNINAVYSDLSNIDTLVSNRQLFIDVGSHLEDVETVSTYMSDVRAVSYIKNAVTNVAGNSTRVTTVSNNIEDVQMCSGNIASIRTCAANISTIGSKVSKTGDIMTGGLGIESASPRFYNKSTVVDYTNTTTPQSTSDLISLAGFDKNNNLASGFFSSFDTNNNFSTGSFVRRKINGTEKEGAFVLSVDSTGYDFAYASSGVKQTITNWAFPSTNQLVLITMQASGATYTSPCDGWFGCRLQGSAAGSTNAYNVTADPNGRFLVTFSFYNAGEWRAGFIPVKKGDVIRFEYYNLYFTAGEIFWMPAVGG